MISRFPIVTITTFLCLSILTVVNAQSDGEESITPQILQQIVNTVKKDAYTKAMMNAVSNNDIKKLALNRSKLDQIDEHFAYKIETGEITNQKSSGRCWLFTSLNVLRTHIIKKYNLENFEFSENYLFFWDQFEKANLFLEGVIATRKKGIDDREVEWLFKNAIGDGGVWNMVVDLVEKYGLVPREAMSESFSSENTRRMNRLVKRKIREGGYLIREMHEKGKNVDELREQKVKILQDVYRILLICLGEPPKQFNWRYMKEDSVLSNAITYTPQEFYRKFVEVDLRDYVMMMNDPSKKYYKLYEIEYDRNLFEGQNWTFINLPKEVLKQFAKKSILADEPMYFSCDVGKQLNEEDGFLALGLYDYESLFGVNFGMGKKERILTFDSGSTHGMALMGVDTNDTGKTTKWLLENSWGENRGFEGYLIMTDEWMNEYMFRLVIRKQFLSDKVLKVLDQDPIKLPPWDPLF